MIETKNSSSIEKIKNQVACPVELSLRVLGGKWRGSILYQLRNGGLRFNDLKNRVQDAVVDYEDADNFLTNKVLSSHLKELQEFDLIEKQEKNGLPGLYRLSAKGESVIPILLDLFDWGEKNF